jgi:quercetin dioxygenase-like cupin family protein
MYAPGKRLQLPIMAGFGTFISDRTSMQTPNIRRVVTGHDEAGRAVVTIDETCTHFQQGRPGGFVCNIWTTETTPADNSSAVDGGLREGKFTMIENGTVFRILDFRPGIQARSHRTDTIDYITVLSGQIDMELEPGGEEVHLKAGDVMVQRGTVHNWINRGTESCVMAIVLVHAQSAVAGGKTLPAVG